MNPHAEELDIRTAHAEGRRRFWFVLGLSAMLLALDFSSGPYIQFPVLYILPVMLAAWVRGAVAAIALGLVLTLSRLSFNFIWDEPMRFAPAVANSVLRAFVFATIAVVTATMAMHMQRLKQRVRQLEARLPVCRACGVIREEDGTWAELTRAKSTRSHCMCPACEEKHYGSVA